MTHIIDGSGKQWYSEVIPVDVDTTINNCAVIWLDNLAWHLAMRLLAVPPNLFRVAILFASRATVKDEPLARENPGRAPA